MKKKLLFIYNAHAGKGRIRNKLVDILEIFARNDYDVTVSPTLRHGEAAKVAEERCGEFELLVCSGGDGTLDEVVTGIIKSGCHVPIGYIPAGSTNDYGNSLGLPKNMQAAAKIAVGSQMCKCDVGELEDTIFVYVAAFGAFTEVSYATPQEIKNMLGHAAYIIEGMKKLHTIRAYHMKVSANGETIEDDFIYGMVTNSVSIGGFKNNTSANVVLDDGLFEVTLIKNPKNPIELQNIIASLLIAEFDSKYMYAFKASEITFEAESEIPWTVDGEFGGKRKCAKIVNHKQAISIKVNQKKVFKLMEQEKIQQNYSLLNQDMID